MIVIRSLLPRRFEWVLFRAETLPEPNLAGLEVVRFGPGEPVGHAEYAWLRDRFSRLSLWYLLSRHRRGGGWVFLARCEGKLCHYTLLGPAARFRRRFPTIDTNALLIGPCLTTSDFRGRAIYPRMIQHVVHSLHREGHGPFLIHTDTTNYPSVCGIEKAGFVRCGVWAGRRALFGAWVNSKRLSN